MKHWGRKAGFKHTKATKEKIKVSVRAAYARYLESIKKEPEKKVKE